MNEVNNMNEGVKVDKTPTVGEGSVSAGLVSNKEIVERFSKKLPEFEAVVCLGFTKEALQVEGQASPKHLAMASEQMLGLAFQIQSEQHAAGLI